MSVKLQYFRQSKPSVDLFDNCLIQARHGKARQRPTSLPSWSTGNEGGDEESKLLHVLVEGESGERTIAERQTRHNLPVILSFFTFFCRSCSYLAVKNLVAILSEYEFVARIHQSTGPCNVLDLPLILSSEPQYHSTQGHE